jgi:hypothetical protein
LRELGINLYLEDDYCNGVNQAQEKRIVEKEIREIEEEDQEEEDEEDEEVEEEEGEFGNIDEGCDEEDGIN